VPQPVRADHLGDVVDRGGRVVEAPVGSGAPCPQDVAGDAAPGAAYAATVPTPAPTTSAAASTAGPRDIFIVTLLGSLPTMT